MLAFGVVVLGVTDRRRAEEFWCAALGRRALQRLGGRPELGQADAQPVRARSTARRNSRI